MWPIFLRFLFFLLLVKPFLLLAVGISVRGRQRLPHQGPALIVANHNSHLDALALAAILPLRLLPHTRPAASAEYFLRGRWRSWFARKVIGIIPVATKGGAAHAEVLHEVKEALLAGDLVIFFPEGTRGEPEALGQLKSGIVWLAETLPEVPIYPIRLRGLGKVLPKGTWLPVPFFCDAWVGERLRWEGDRQRFMTALVTRLTEPT